MSNRNWLRNRNRCDNVVSNWLRHRLRNWLRHRSRTGDRSREASVELGVEDLAWRAALDYWRNTLSVDKFSACWTSTPRTARNKRRRANTLSQVVAHKREWTGRYRRWDRSHRRRNRGHDIRTGVAKYIGINDTSISVQDGIVGSKSWWTTVAELAHARIKNVVGQACAVAQRQILKVKRNQDAIGLCHSIGWAHSTSLTVGLGDRSRGRDENGWVDVSGGAAIYGRPSGTTGQRCIASDKLGTTKVVASTSLPESKRFG